MSTSLGKYKLVREIGRGGMGVVYEAHDTVLQRRVALKVLRADKAQSPDHARSNEKRFLQEARLAARLNHPDIVTVYEAGILEGRRFIAMEYLEARQFCQWRQFGPSSRAQVALLSRVARAVQHAHDLSVVHRDLKPQNILVDVNGNPHITDFGLALALAQDIRLTGEDFTVGTPVYMSPEQAEGSKALDGRTDVYALGVMLFEILTNHVPYSGDSALQVLVRASKDPVPRPSRMGGDVSELAKDEVLEKICVKALSKNPASRQPTAAALADALDAWLAGRAVPEPRKNGRKGSSRSTASGRRALRPSTRRAAQPRKSRAGMVTAVAAASVVLLSIVLLMAGPGQGQVTHPPVQPDPGPVENPVEARVAALEAFAAGTSDPQAILAKCDDLRTLAAGTPFEGRVRKVETKARAQRSEREESRRIDEAVARIRELILSDPEGRRRDEILGLLKATMRSAGPRHGELERLQSEYEALLGRLESSKSPAVSVPNGLVGYWRFEEGDSAKGTRDASGRDHTGRVVGDPEWTRGWSGKGLRFQGRSEYIEFSDTSDLRFVQDGDYTIAAWCRPEPLPSSAPSLDADPHYAIFTKGGWGEGLVYRVRDGRFILQHWLKGGVWAGSIGNEVATPPGRWYHVTGVVSRLRNETSVYIDARLANISQWRGQKRFKSPDAQAMGDHRWRIGIQNPDPVGEQLEFRARGIIDEVRLYARALQPGEIRTIFDESRAEPRR